MNLKTIIEQNVSVRVATFVADMSDLIRRDVVEQVRRNLLGEPRQTSIAQHFGYDAPRDRWRVFTLGDRRRHRTQKEIDETLDRIWKYVWEHPHTRSEFVRRDLKLSQAVMLDSMRRLRSDGRLSMEGTRRAATYVAKNAR